MSKNPATGLPAGYNRRLLLLLLVAGLGGLLYGIDIGIIDPALGYLGKTISMTEENCSVIVAAVLGGSMFASVIAGFFADLLSHKMMMLMSAVMFVASVAIIFTSQSYVLLLGRILQGMSGGVIAVVVPLYLTECLKADTTGKGGDIVPAKANEGLAKEFPEIASRISIHVPDEKTRSVGQAVAAASLPKVAH